MFGRRLNVERGAPDRMAGRCALAPMRAEIMEWKCAVPSRNSSTCQCGFSAGRERRWLLFSRPDFETYSHAVPHWRIAMQVRPKRNRSRLSLALRLKCLWDEEKPIQETRMLEHPSPRWNFFPQPVFRGRPGHSKVFRPSSSAWSCRLHPAARSTQKCKSPCTRGFASSIDNEPGRGERSRTSGLYVPNVALYLTKLHPANTGCALGFRICAPAIEPPIVAKLPCTDSQEGGWWPPRRAAPLRPQPGG